MPKKWLELDKFISLGRYVAKLEFTFYSIYYVI